MKFWLVIPPARGTGSTRPDQIARAATREAERSPAVSRLTRALLKAPRRHGPYLAHSAATWNIRRLSRGYANITRAPYRREAGTSSSGEAERSEIMGHSSVVLSAATRSSLFSALR